MSALVTLKYPVMSALLTVSPVTRVMLALVTAKACNVSTQSTLTNKIRRDILC